MTFSRSSLITFGQLLDGYQIPSGHPQLVQLAQQVALARTELLEALAELDAEPVPEAEAIVQHAGTMEDPDPADPVYPARVKNL